MGLFDHGGALDTSVYGYMSAAIKKPDVKALRQHVQDYHQPKYQKDLKSYLNAVDQDKNSLVDLALASEDPDIIQLILFFPGIDLEREHPKTKQSGAKHLQKLNETQLNEALSIAAKTLNKQMLETLLKTDEQREAQSVITSDMITALIDAYSSITNDDLKEQGALQFSAMVALLQDKITPELINCKGAGGDSLLHIAAEMGDPDLMALLLAKKPNIDLMNDEGITPLKRAVMWDQTEVQNLLVKAGANMDFTVGADLSESSAVEIRRTILEDALSERSKDVVINVLQSDKFDTLLSHIDGERALSLARDIINFNVVDDDDHHHQLPFVDLLLAQDKKHNFLSLNDIKQLIKEEIGKGKGKDADLELVEKLAQHAIESRKLSREDNDEFVQLILHLPNADKIMPALCTYDLQHNCLKSKSMSEFLQNMFKEKKGILDLLWRSKHNSKEAIQREVHIGKLLVSHALWKSHIWEGRATLEPASQASVASSLPAAALSGEWLQALFIKLQKSTAPSPEYVSIFNNLTILMAKDHDKSSVLDAGKTGGLFSISPQQLDQMVFIALRVGNSSGVKHATSMLKALPKDRSKFIKALLKTSDEKFALAINELAKLELLSEIDIDLFTALNSAQNIIKIKALLDNSDHKDQYKVDLISLYKAGNIEMLHAYIKNNVGDINAKDENGDTLLSIAMRAGHFELCKQLINTPDIDLHCVNEQGCTPLAQLCLSQADEDSCLEMKQLLYQGFDKEPNGFDKERKMLCGLPYSYVECAYRSGKPELALSFLEGAEASQDSKIVHTREMTAALLFLAADKEDIATLKQILSLPHFALNDATPIMIKYRNIKDVSVYASLLARLCEKGNISGIKALLEYKAANPLEEYKKLDVNKGFVQVAGEDVQVNISPIIIALNKLMEELAKGDKADKTLIAKYSEIVNLLAKDKRTDLQVEISPGFSIFHALASCSTIDKQSIFASRKDDIDMSSVDLNGNTVLMTLMQSGDYPFTLSLIQEDKNIKAMLPSVNKAGQSALMLGASILQNDESFSRFAALYNTPKMLLHKDQYNNTALHYAIASGNLEKAQNLCAQYERCIPNFKLDRTFIPAAYAACNPEIIAFIKGKIGAELDVSYVDPIHGSALHCVIASNNKNSPKICEELLQTNININAQNRYGVTPLMIAVEKGDLQKVQLLMQKIELDVNLTDKAGNTVLMIACKEGRHEIMHALLMNPHININARNNEGINALMIAAHKEIREVEQPAESGTDKKPEKQWVSDKEAIKMLVERGADPNSGYASASFKHRVIRVIAKVSLYTFISKVTSWFFPPAQYLAEAARDVLNAQAIGSELGELAAQQIRRWFSTDDAQLSNTCFIGNFHIDRMGLVHYGNDLRAALHGHPYYHNSASQSLYTCDALKANPAAYGITDDAARYKLHLDFINKYVVVQAALSRTWMPWNRYALQCVAKEIMKADNHVMNMPHYLDSKVDSKIARGTEWRVDFAAMRNPPGMMAPTDKKEATSWATLCRIVDSNTPIKIASLLGSDDKWEQIKYVLESIVFKKIAVDPKMYCAAHNILKEYNLRYRSSPPGRKGGWFTKSINIDKLDIAVIADSIWSQRADAKLVIPSQIRDSGDIYQAPEMINHGAAENTVEKVAGVVEKGVEAVSTVGILYAQRQDVRTAAYGLACVAWCISATGLLGAGAVGGLLYGIYRVIKDKKSDVIDRPPEEEFNALQAATKVAGLCDIPHDIDVDTMPASATHKSAMAKTEEKDEYLEMVGGRTFVERLMSARSAIPEAGMEVSV